MLRLLAVPSILGDGAVTALEGFLQGLARRGRSRGHLVHVQEIPARAPRFADLTPPLPESLRAALQHGGIERLYTHQVDAIAQARAGRDVLVVTGTASGKSLAYQLPVLETLVRDPEARALFLFPTKALEQDQLKSLRQLLPWGSGIRAEILDGDTPAHRRAQLKAQPPQILISNPDLLHLSLLPHHAAWKPFWVRLQFVVLDELHTYKGIFGSHIAHVLRRLHRVTAVYGCRPRFVASSAIISNPAEFARDLAGREGTPRLTPSRPRTQAPGSGRDSRKIPWSRLRRDLAGVWPGGMSWISRRRGKCANIPAASLGARVPARGGRGARRRLNLCPLSPSNAA